MFKFLTKKWMNASKEHPVVFNSLNAGFLFGLGDYLQQNSGLLRKSGREAQDGDFEMDLLDAGERRLLRGEEVDEYDYYQTGKMVAYGMCAGPMFHYWYSKILPVFVPVGAGEAASTAQALKKVIVDYAIASSAVSVMFPAWNGVLDGLDNEAIKQKVKNEFPVLMAAELAFWPLFNFIVFKKVPIKLQTLSVCVGTIAWASILSSIQSSKDVNFGEEAAKLLSGLLEKATFPERLSSRVKKYGALNYQDFSHPNRQY